MGHDFKMATSKEPQGNGLADGGTATSAEMDDRLKSASRGYDVRKTSNTQSQGMHRNIGLSDKVCKVLRKVRADVPIRMLEKGRRIGALP